MLHTHHTLPTLTLLLMLLRDQLSQLLVMELFLLDQLLMEELFLLDQLLVVELFLLDQLLEVELFLLDQMLAEGLFLLDQPLVELFCQDWEMLARLLLMEKVSPEMYCFFTLIHILGTGRGQAPSK